MATIGETFPAALIIKSRNPGNHVPKFQAKFHVAEEDSEGPR